MRAGNPGAGETAEAAARHHGVVRATHWVTAVCFLALLVSGANLVISHPRFYWGETGNVLTPALFQIPIPASRPYVQSGYGFVMPDQNGWSRSLHFQAAWFVLFTGLVYVAFSVRTRHLVDDLLPARTGVYNPLQRLVYLAVVYGLFPLMIWTGLAMSPAVVSVFPPIVTSLGGHQSARTIHFFTSLSLAGFLAVHVAMVYRAGFVSLTRAMITGGAPGSRSANETTHTP